MDYNTKSAIVGGTFFSSIMNIGVADLITTIVLAFVGAAVSFFVSMILKFLFERVKTRFKK
jgi:ABC-type phosphate/phosphonate transport system permease subunit